MMRANLRSIILSAVLFALYSCSESPPVFHHSERPLRLSEWKLFASDSGALIPNQSSMVFRPNNQLFTDYAHKLRTLWIPAGAQASIEENDISYPVGTVLSKTFYYPRASGTQLAKSIDEGLEKIDLAENQLIETRLLVRKQDGWDAFPYVWNEEQSEALLRIAGASTSISLSAHDKPDQPRDEIEQTDFTYFVPNENQCSSCHVSVHPDGDMHPLGAILSQLNSFDAAKNPDTESLLERMLARGWLRETAAAAGSQSWENQSAPVADRALAYLNMHCGHCHNAKGAADTSGLILDGSQTLAVNRGVCKPPVAAGGGTGGLLYGIVPGQPEQSILLYRMQSKEPDEMMPELGRSLIHAEGVDLISRWIAEIPGSC